MYQEFSSGKLMADLGLSHSDEYMKVGRSIPFAHKAAATTASLTDLFDYNVHSNQRKAFMLD